MDNVICEHGIGTAAFCKQCEDKTHESKSAPVAGYKAHLIALCEGLEINEIDDLMTKPPEYFRELGQMMADIFKHAKNRLA